jgi:hypothetical protein
MLEIDPRNVVDENRNEGKAAPEIDLVGGAHGLCKNLLASSHPPGELQG